MARFLTAYFVAAVYYLGLDMVWLSQMTSILYKPALAPLLAEQFSLAPTVLFYVIYMTGLTRLAIVKAVRWQQAVFCGGLFGLSAYGTYDLTNQATLRDWSATLTTIDLLWGTLLTGSAAGVGYAAASMLGRRR